ncbi:Glycerol-1-phosphate dehydrogenase [NAD(P)+] [Aquisphaera giovannonii]|uniref:Glycerol-1-phosphate dehydrogenase [NAD(P)+] n=1 Tax=Aquisphaera giovannonii TaxID=406548 RepID=A0A5B9WCQ0_9BACT|nr:sn-glycerol-1-phosphate dehydrogenase [Aquisphaera giovannonii]QEH38273.1 Glycerol-1-phosphate dehydrogenase [NAD(P)+] [Aquisphaera giovannonii]
MSGLDEALNHAEICARETRRLVIEAGARHRAAEAFAGLFAGEQAVVVADERTFEAAGREVFEGFRRAGRPASGPVLFPPDIVAEDARVLELQSALEGLPGIPVVVGSGTLNDLTKLASHRLGRPYMVVATAASMDGYTAFGASILHEGSKQTFACPAPVAVLADLDVIARAPREMNAAGYADLLAKNVAGADWILADAAGVEPIDGRVWEMVHGPFRSWVESPAGIARGEPPALGRLVLGLMTTGLAMQEARSSRPASGAEHQFSHLWDMQHHIHGGSAPSHGFKVGIGTLASLALHEDLLGRDLQDLDVDRAVGRWPTLGQIEERIGVVLGTGSLGAKAVEEARAKYPTREQLRSQLASACNGWPASRARLARHLIPARDARDMLRAAGCPTEPEQIGIDRDRLRASFEQASYIRRRFTILDLMQRLNLMAPAMERLFGPEGAWPVQD